MLAVDIDRELLPAAKRHHAALLNVTWLLADVLAGKHQIEPRVLAALRELRARHPAGELKLVSNLPYNAASPLIAELLVEMWRAVRVSPPLGRESESGDGSIRAGEPPAEPGAYGPLLFSRLAFTVQWEVAKRMNARPDTRDYGPLGIRLQAMAKVEIVRKIAPGAFWPPPKIQSALVVVAPDAARMRQIADAPGLQKFLAGIFSHRRQTLGNALKHFYGDAWQAGWKNQLADAGFDLQQRPEVLSIADLIRLEQTGKTSVP